MLWSLPQHPLYHLTPHSPAAGSVGHLPLLLPQKTRCSETTCMTLGITNTVNTQTVFQGRHRRGEPLLPSRPLARHNSDTAKPTLRVRWTPCVLVRLQKNLHTFALQEKTQCSGMHSHTGRWGEEVRLGRKRMEPRGFLPGKELVGSPHQFP